MERGEASRKVWYVLVNKDGSPYGETSTSGIHVDTSKDVDDLREAVIKKYRDEKAVLLDGISSSQLVVYANKNSFDKRNEENQAPLKSSFVLYGLGVTEEDALIVVVPSISDDSINKRRKINDDGDGWEKWLREFRKSEIAFDDLPPLENLKKFIEAELPVKIAITLETKELWMAKMKASSELMNKLFTTSDPELCIGFKEEILNRIVTPVEPGSTEASYISLWDDMISHVLQYVLVNVGRSDRNSSQSASTLCKRPDFIFLVDSVCVFRGEEKAHGYNFAAPCAELTDKLEWRYGDISYLFGYAAVGYKVQLNAITRVEVLSGHQVAAIKLGEFDLHQLYERFRLLLALLNISRLFRSIASNCPPSGKDETGTIERPDGINILLKSDYVIKTFPKEDIFQKAKSHAEKVYNVLETNDIPNVDTLVQVRSSKRGLVFKPRGDDQRPSTLTELFCALKDILQALIGLHAASWMHRDIRWSNVMKSRETSDKWFLIDFMDAAESPQISPSDRLLNPREHAPEINDSHTVKVDIWSVGHLISTSQRYMLENWYDLGNRRSQFLDSLLEKDPSKRPTAAEALITLQELEQLYHTQCQASRARRVN